MGRCILFGSREIIELVGLIESVTPSYNQNERGRIIAKNLRSKIQPYYTKYRQLQRLCIQILRRGGLKYTSKDEKNKVYGVLFDCAWLWEEYINSLFKQNSFRIIHPENKKNKSGIILDELNFKIITGISVTATSCGLSSARKYK